MFISFNKTLTCSIYKRSVQSMLPTWLVDIILAIKQLAKDQDEVEIPLRKT